MNRGDASQLAAKNLTMKPFVALLSVQHAAPKTRLPARLDASNLHHDHLNYFGGAR